MISFIWPMALVIISNTVYQICTKSVPNNVSPLASLTLTYLLAAIASAILHYIIFPDLNIFKQISSLNWSSYALGICIIGLEVGWIYAYKAGWEISIGNIVQSVILTIALIVLGTFLYKESVTWNKLVGIFICLIGLFFINMK